MKQSQSLASYEPNISEDTPTSFIRSVVVKENSILLRKKSLFEFEPFYVKKRLSVHTASSIPIHQSKSLPERLFIFSTSNKSFDNESVDDYFKFCPLIPNGEWVHIPFNWLSMMASVIEVINTAIKEDDIEIIYQLKESQKEFYKQLVNSIPITSSVKMSTAISNELKTIDNCVDLVTSQIFGIQETFFPDEKDDLSSQSHKADKSHQWFIPCATSNSPYFDVAESTPFNDLLEFMMNLPTVVRKSKVVLNSDNMLTE